MTSVGPLLPGLGNSIATNGIPGLDDGIKHLYSIDWLFGFVVSIFLYTGLSWLFPARESLSTVTIFGHELDGEYEVRTADGEKGYGGEKSESLKESYGPKEAQESTTTELKGVEG